MKAGTQVIILHHFWLHVPRDSDFRQEDRIISDYLARRHLTARLIWTKFPLHHPLLDYRTILQDKYSCWHFIDLTKLSFTFVAEFARQILFSFFHLLWIARNFRSPMLLWLRIVSTLLLCHDQDEKSVIHSIILTASQPGKSTLLGLFYA